MKHKSLFILIMLSISSPCFAYLNPGNGYLLLQALLAGVAGILLAVRLYWQQVKNYFKKLFKKDKQKNEEK